MKKSFDSFQKTVLVSGKEFERQVMKIFDLRKEKTKKLFSKIFFGSNSNTNIKTKNKFNFDFNEAKPVIAWFALLAIAVGGRAAFQGIPSVEPIIPITVFAGYLLGPMGAAALGFNAYMASNFVVWGGQGWWTVFQAVGGAVAGLIAGIYYKFKKPTFLNSAMLVVVGTLVFELSVNAPWTIMAGLPSLLLAIPFTFTHFASNVVFSQAIPFVSKMNIFKN
ncbi:MAG: ECF transporter S component, partial [Candidatus Diapherotrites archaeon]|nr:ECF transporter S component [Candidatus Diapherotrites archaeon]